MGIFRTRSYSKYEEILIAIVTNLSFTSYDKRTPKYLAQSLSVPVEDVEFCLDNFKSLFRKSRIVSKSSKSPFYALQIRYAQQWLKDDEPEGEGEPSKEPPMSAEHYQVLVSYITGKAAAERGSKTGYYIAVISAIAALIAAYIAISGGKCG